MILGALAAFRAESALAQTNPWYVPPAGPDPAYGYGGGHASQPGNPYRGNPANSYGGYSDYTTQSLPPTQGPATQGLGAGYQPPQPVQQQPRLLPRDSYDSEIAQPSYQYFGAGQRNATAAAPGNPQDVIPGGVPGPYWSSQSQPLRQQPAPYRPAYRPQPYGDYPPLGSDPTLAEAPRAAASQPAQQSAAAQRPAAVQPSLIDPALAAGPSTLTTPYGGYGGYGLPYGAPYGGGLAPFPGLPFW
jgi:hypothetical protein